MRIFLFYVNQFILMALLGYLACWPTLKTGTLFLVKSKGQGLYWLEVPGGLLALVIVFSILKYLMIRRMSFSAYFKWGFLLTVVISAVDSLLVSVSISSIGFLIVTFLTLAWIFILLIEMILARKVSL